MTAPTAPRVRRLTIHVYAIGDERDELVGLYVPSRDLHLRPEDWNRVGLIAVATGPARPVLVNRAEPTLPSSWRLPDLYDRVKGILWDHFPETGEEAKGLWWHQTLRAAATQRLRGGVHVEVGDETWGRTTWIG